MDKSNDIVSPITKGPVKYLFDIDKSILVKDYLRETNIDINYLLNKIPTIKLYECEETSYRFFKPFGIEGDSSFYEQLEQIPWYYSKWKWEFGVANKYIEKNSKVLDIGCGEASFLEYISKEKECSCIGLELNEKAKNIANKKGILVYNENIQDHSIKNKSQYDIVTFFQVLEHISDVNGFLNAAVSTLKQGGKIILAVPNNEPYYLTFDKYHFLNLPPHHMGWWNEKSLAALCDVYDLNLIEIKRQPLEHYKSYTKNYIKEKLNLPKFLIVFFEPILKIYFYLNRRNINGASILAVYSKK